MCFPPTGMEQANPVTPQPPSSSTLAFGFGGNASINRPLEARILSAGEGSLLRTIIFAPFCILIVIQMPEAIGPANHLPDAAHTEALQNIHHLFAPGGIEIENSLSAPVRCHQFR